MRAKQIDRELTCQSTSQWDYHRDCEGTHQFGEPPSVFRDMARDVLQLAATDSTIRKTIVKLDQFGTFKDWDPLALFNVSARPWHIPTGKELDKIADQVAVHWPDHPLDYGWTKEYYEDNGFLYRFWAAR
jgi:hypothetical protein